MRNQAGEKGETEEVRAESGTGKAAVRRNREEMERKNRRLSSWKRKTSGRKKGSRKWKMLEAKAEGKHLWNGCGSETGKDERKQTGKLSKQNWKEGTGNQAGDKGKDLRNERTEGAPGSRCEENRKES